ncbi:TraB/GumN family protein [Novosphingobium colocasiae]|uniref:TraB/GumN family protein n=1 Tax=Novosphingobium colocasiae TaxID=1256513 RepID=A0A918PBV2_9SPHN|nr:TraB/GumN family protein [Novosphingobium colocasiae]GGY97654.1 hypothetical protein GCM10011614_10890 [Novosphingobium colocasiae]
MAFRKTLVAIALALLASCSEPPQPASPALWRIEGAGGQTGWLFGTIHSADAPLEWRTDTVGAALDASAQILVEVADLADGGQVAATFTRLARSQTPLPPLSQRIAAEDRPALTAELKRAGYKDSDFAAMETWAAALTLAQAGQGQDDARNGVDRAVIAAAGGRPVVELEGATYQLGLFDALPEKEQRDLLTALLHESVVEGEAEDRKLLDQWRKGDMAAIEAETRRGLLADPELRAVLFTGRNKAWTERIIAALKSGRKPFVAVGAAHMAGPEGLPAMLAARGYKVTRIE